MESSLTDIVKLCEAEKVKSPLRLFLALAPLFKDYDLSVCGPIGEAYAEEVLGMVKAPKLTKGYDGIIADKKVQVKAKVLVRKLNSGFYVAINPNNIGFADDLLIVCIPTDGTQPYHIGPVPFAELQYKTDSVGLYRYYYNHIIEVCSKLGLNK
tara:strand:- start:277 stop:738 length:462 start_codon:yes stop_codon:yes gene_type:complete